MSIDIGEAQSLIELFKDIMNDRIVVGCVTCNIFFLNMKWKDYLPLLNGDFTTPTKWYNAMAMHYCQHPTHEILSNRNPRGINQMTNFTETFNEQLRRNDLTLQEFTAVVYEMQRQTENKPI
jgi:hypothetical protein